MIPQMDWGALNNRHRLFAFVVLVVCATLLVAFWTAGTQQAIVIACALIIMFWVTKAIWLPDGYGRSKVAMMSLAVVMSTTLLVVGARHWFEPLVFEFLKEIFGPRFSPVEGTLEGDGKLSAMVLAFVWSAVYVVNYGLRDKSMMQVHPVPLDEEFPEKGYRQQLKQFCDVLHHHLRILNTQTNWSDAFFTPLEAQVEIATGSRTKRRITNLLGAIKSDRSSRLFLVLGDPGSGKSVALRTLAMELLGDVEKSGRVPVYLNLREWSASQSWTEENPPTVEHLYEFILDSLKARSDVFGLEFLNYYYRKMLHHGRFFLLLDSFDEIPAVLDVGESSWLIERLSNVIATFFAATGTARGVVSSRLYRRPKFALSQTATLEIRPFTELQIAEALQRSLAFPKTTLQKLFIERSELIPIARNPFTAALIRTYASQNHSELPAHQVQLYEAYLNSRMEAVSERLEKLNLTADEVLAGCQQIGWQMFVGAEFGLEAPIARLEAQLPSTRVRAIVKVLEYARLGRLGESNVETFSFVHRRFAEYFVAMHLIRSPAAVQVSTIPLDSRWRDALVLYCEVVAQPDAERIARFCIEEIDTHGEATVESAQYLRAVHALRFLSDAFRSRPECLGDLQLQLGQYIERHVSRPENPILAKIAVEAVGLLKAQEIERVILQAFRMENSWISETGIRACRHMPRLSEEVIGSIQGYISSLSFGEFMSRRKELLFSLGLSDAFAPLYQSCVRRSTDHLVLAVTLAISAVAFPAAFLIFMGMLLLHILLIPIAKDFAKARGRIMRINPLSELFLTMVRIYSCFLIMMLIILPEIGHSRGLDDVVVGPLGGALSSPGWIVLGIVVFSGFSPLYLLNLIGPFRNFGWLREIVRIFHEMKYSLAGLSLLILLFVILPQRVQKIVAIVLIVPILLAMMIMAGVVAAAVYSSFKKLCTDLWVDRKSFKQLRSRPIRDRDQIEKDLATLQSEIFRLKYMQHVQQTVSSPTGSWSAGGKIFRINDAATVLLAQLEERWLGLDR